MTTPTRIHVNRHRMAANRKGANLPPLGVERGRFKRYGRGARIEGPCRVVYDPVHPLRCGARAWIETYSPVRIIR